MARRFASIPPLTPNNTQEIVRLLASAVGFMAGQTINVVQPLSPTATLPELVAKINEVIARLQGT